MSVTEITFSFADWGCCVEARLAMKKVPVVNDKPIMTDDEWTIEGMRDLLQRKAYEQGKVQAEIDKVALNDDMVTIKKIAVPEEL